MCIKMRSLRETSHRGIGRGGVTVYLRSYSQMCRKQLDDFARPRPGSAES
jgi:hypothetical protein